jgi:hypothetical protein
LSARTSSRSVIAFSSPQLPHGRPSPTKKRQARRRKSNPAVGAVVRHSSSSIALPCVDSFRRARCLDPHTTFQNPTLALTWANHHAIEIPCPCITTHAINMSTLDPDLLYLAMSSCNGSDYPHSVWLFPFPQTASCCLSCYDPHHAIHSHTCNLLRLHLLSLILCLRVCLPLSPSAFLAL